MERYEKLFDVVGWVGFALLTPVALYVFRVQSVVQLMDSKLGFAGKPEFWVLLCFAFVLLRIFFGGEHIILPLFLGFAGGFFLLSLVARIGFMGWFWRPASQQFFFQNDRLTFVVGAAVLFFGLIFSYFRKIGLLVQFLLLILLPMLILLAVNAISLI
ncbi:MAG: hypothetical protein JSV89_09170 [Spirochaetaceae bacterium]|nr:MAG: hypothetical protein JSV89_09170 [Spirochaetaceae bacterium]